MAYIVTDACIGCLACSKICPSHAVTGEKKEIHFINDQTCIECGACGRVCPSNAIMDSFGLVVEKIQKKSWTRPYFNLDICMSCSICLDTCPSSALDTALQKVGSRHLFPFLAHETACMACGFCAQDCPVDAIEMGPRQTKKSTKEKKITEEA